MPLVETLTISLGVAVAKTIVAIWAKDNSVAQTAGSSLAEVVGSVIPGVMNKRKSARQFEAIGDRVAQELLPLFRNAGIHESRQEEITQLAAQTIEGARISPEFLIKTDLDPGELASFLLASDPDATTRHNFSKLERELYQNLVVTSATYIIDIAAELPQFTERAIAEILERETYLLNVIDRISEQINALRIAVQANDPNETAARFEECYRKAVIWNLDRMELFGVDLSVTARRQKLTVAYVSLMADKRPKATCNDSGDGDAPGDILPDNYEESEPPGKTGRIEEILSQGNRFLIRGLAGSGKTTLLRWIAVRAASKSFSEQLAHWNNTVPFFIPLRQFVGREFPEPEEFPSLSAKALAGEMPDGWVRQHLNTDAIILIDGVDELPESQRDGLKNWLTDLANTFPNSRYVVTSRPTAAEEGWLSLDDFADVDVRDMGLEDIHAFIEHWHQAMKEAVAGEAEKARLDEYESHLKGELRNASIRRLATNPLLCAVICALHYDRNQTLPANRLALYSDCCRMLIERRDRERHIRFDGDAYPNLEYEQKLNLLQDLAYWMMRNAKTSIDVALVDERFDSQLTGYPGLGPDVTGVRVRRLLLDRSGIIREPVFGQVDFTHRTFQEYLAAKAATDADDIGFLVSQADNDQWRETIILAVGTGSSNDREELIRGLIQRGDQEPNLRHPMHLLALACMETAVTLSPDLREELGVRLSKLVPPRNMTEAAALATAGELAIPHLGPRGCTAAQAAASARALKLIGTEHAISVLKTFHNETRRTVLQELVRFPEYSISPDVYLSEVICRLQNLTNLDLSDAGISSLPEEIGKLTNLVSLRVRGTTLSSLPQSIHRLAKLAHLDLELNEISSLPESIRSLTKLEHLDLSSNGLVTLPEWIVSLGELESLILRNNLLNSLPDSIGDLVALTELALSGNRLLSLPESIGSMRALQTLDVSHNKLSSVPASIGNLENLTILKLRGNQIRVLPDSIGDLHNLTYLGLAKNELVSLPETVAKLDSLETLELGYGPIPPAAEELYWIYFHTMGHVAFPRLDVDPALDFGGNNLDVLPTGIGDLASLKTLIVSRNHITVLPDAIGELTNLEVLILSHNHLVELPETIGDLINLRTLSVSDNYLTEVPQQLISLARLRALDLRNNSLAEVPSVLKCLGELVYVGLQGNQISDEDILRQLPDSALVNPFGMVIERREGLHYVPGAYVRALAGG